MQEQSQSRAERAAKIDLLNSLDGFSELRNGLKRVAEARGDWAGIPMPIEGQRLIIEPKFPNAEGLMSMYSCAPEPGNGEKIRNMFWSSKLRANVIVWENTDGSIEWGRSGRGHHFDQDLNTLMCMDVWGIEQESAAVLTFASLVRHRQMKQYMLTGMFLETSKRSNITYMFRRLKPTVAMRASNDKMRILTTLCLHPIAYYDRSWAGAMVPTDDVIAHLMLMRGDEHGFWKQSNQHPAWKPEAGL